MSDHFHRARLHFAFGRDHHHGVFFAARYGLLRHEERIQNAGQRQFHAHEHAAHQRLVGVGHGGAHHDLAGAFFHGAVDKQQAAFVFVFAAVFQKDAHFHAVVTHAVAGKQLLAKTQQISGRLLDIHIQHVGLADGGHLRAACADQRTFGHQRLADNAADGRGDIGMVHIDLCGADGGLRCFNRGFCRTFGQHGRVIFLFADGIGGNQRLVACQIGIGFSGGGLRAQQACACVFQRGAVGRIVQLVQWLSLADKGAFFKQAACDDAAHLRHNHGGAYGFQAAGQFGFNQDVFRFHGYHVHGRNVRGFCGSGGFLCFF